LNAKPGYPSLYNADFVGLIQPSTCLSGRILLARQFSIESSNIIVFPTRFQYSGMTGGVQLQLLIFFIRTSLLLSCGACCSTSYTFAELMKQSFLIKFTNKMNPG